MDSLRSQPELFKVQDSPWGNCTWIVSAAGPSVLLSVTGLESPPCNLTAIYHTAIHYAGSVESTMFFRSKNSTHSMNAFDSVLSSTHVLCKLEAGGGLEIIRTVDTKLTLSRVLFLHRQPFYIQRSSGWRGVTYHLHNFEVCAPVELENVQDVFLDNNLPKIYHRSHLILLRSYSSLNTVNKYLVERISRNVLIVSNMHFSEHCTAYTGDHLDFVYIATGKNKLFVFHTAELHMSCIKFGPEIKIDVRCVHHDSAILASDYGLFCLKLGAQHWKKRLEMAAETDLYAQFYSQHEQDLQHADNERITAKKDLFNEKVKTECLRGLNKMYEEALHENKARIKELKKTIKEDGQIAEAKFARLKLEHEQERQIAEAKFARLKLEHEQLMEAESKKNDERLSKAQAQNLELNKKYNFLLQQISRAGLGTVIQESLTKDVAESRLDKSDDSATSEPSEQGSSESGQFVEGDVPNEDAIALQPVEKATADGDALNKLFS